MSDTLRLSGSMSSGTIMMKRGDKVSKVMETMQALAKAPTAARTISLDQEESKTVSDLKAKFNGEKKTKKEQGMGLVATRRIEITKHLSNPNLLAKPEDSLVGTRRDEITKRMKGSRRNNRSGNALHKGQRAHSGSSLSRLATNTGGTSFGSFNHGNATWNAYSKPGTKKEAKQYFAVDTLPGKHCNYSESSYAEDATATTCSITTADELDLVSEDNKRSKVATTNMVWHRPICPPAASLAEALGNATKTIREHNSGTAAPRRPCSSFNETFRTVGGSGKDCRDTGRGCIFVIDDPKLARTKVIQVRLNKAAQKIQRFFRYSRAVLNGWVHEVQYWQNEKDDIARRRKEEMSDVQVYLEIEKQKIALELALEYNEKEQNLTEEGMARTAMIEDLKEQLSFEKIKQEREESEILKESIRKMTHENAMLNRPDLENEDKMRDLAKKVRFLNQSINDLHIHGDKCKDTMKEFETKIDSLVRKTKGLKAENRIRMKYIQKVARFAERAIAEELMNMKGRAQQAANATEAVAPMEVESLPKETQGEVEVVSPPEPTQEETTALVEPKKTEPLQEEETKPEEKSPKKKKRSKDKSMKDKSTKRDKSMKDKSMKRDRSMKRSTSPCSPVADENEPSALMGLVTAESAASKIKKRAKAAAARKAAKLAKEEASKSPTPIVADDDDDAPPLMSLINSASVGAKIKKKAQAAAARKAAKLATETPELTVADDSCAPLMSLINCSIVGSKIKKRAKAAAARKAAKLAKEAEGES